MTYFLYPHQWRYLWFHWYQVCLLNRLYLNSLVYDQNIFGSSSKVSGNFIKSSEIFRKCSGTFVWSSEQFWKVFGKWSEILGKSWKPRNRHVCMCSYTAHIPDSFMAVYNSSIVWDRTSACKGASSSRYQSIFGSNLHFKMLHSIRNTQVEYLNLI